MKFSQNKYISFENQKLQRKSRKMAPSQKIEVRWKSKWYDHMMLILSQNQTSIHEKHFPCGTFSYQHGFINEKHVQRGSSHKKSRCPWDGVYLCTSITLRALPSDKQWQRAVNRQPVSRSDNLQSRSAFLDNFNMFSRFVEIFKNVDPFFDF